MADFSPSEADFLAVSSSSCISDSWSCRSLISVWYCSLSIFTWNSLTNHNVSQDSAGAIHIPDETPAQLHLNSHADAAPAQVRMLGPLNTEVETKTWQMAKNKLPLHDRTEEEEGDKWCQPPHKSLTQHTTTQTGREHLIPAVKKECGKQAAAPTP